MRLFQRWLGYQLAGVGLTVFLAVALLAGTPAAVGVVLVAGPLLYLVALVGVVGGWSGGVTPARLLGGLLFSGLTVVCLGWAATAGSRDAAMLPVFAGLVCDVFAMLGAWLVLSGDGADDEQREPLPSIMH